MMRFAILSLAALSVSGTVPALSQEAIANRFILEKTENGFVRMDTGTGEMSICSLEAGKMVCRLTADERRAYEEALSELSDRVAALEQRLQGGAPNEDGTGIPDDEELDRAVGAMEKMMRRFFGMVEDLRREFDVPTGDPAMPLPDRT
ncbi:MAG: hypothetical protein RIC18_14555 [Hoeflea sp.]|uniref:hypothetical protein n=1 Tax=Hoeflea sp. TaxID=1940281 RepID=UPI0032EE6782